MRQDSLQTAQLGFDDLLAEAEAMNQAAAFERATGHLPDTMEEALPAFHDLIDRHHAAMLAGAFEAAIGIRNEAASLALSLNRGAPGILAGPDAPGCVLARLTAADPGTVPLWGQAGTFVIVIDGMQVRIEIDGLFGIGARSMPWPGFSAHVVERDRPFLSETGYRSFLGIQAEPTSGLTPDTFAEAVIRNHVRHALRGRLLAVKAQWSREPPIS